ncbi:hypothetical protein WA1_25180 [Scytonema hofmannii PCC 7110]|uniref:Uncharacterized protein n=1 Tax=Scytonema hofmannii PCC 7110 TaxID=128403 RepID=A0A139X877_9CYAN|nr:hypothetical protein [Scytonema hofmannii]KYC40911.1 hypothetical protein WA1_25180 [Scytonema hofmannii PCC 7110]
METLTSAAIATLLLTKMIEKVGEKVGEKLPDLGSKALEQMGKLKQVLWRKAPETASAIERVTYQPELVEQQSEDYGLEVLTEKMEVAAKADPEVAEIVEALATEVRPQLPENVVRQVMASGIKAKGKIKAGDMNQEAKPATKVEQVMGSDIETEGDIEFGNLTQK